MGSRLLLAALAWLAAGALAHAAAGASSPSARAWVGAALLALIGGAIAWPLARKPKSTPPVTEPPIAPNAQRLDLLQAQLEHLPVAAWVLDEAAASLLRPLSARAHRLQAPGGVRDAAALQALLREQTQSGPVQLDTERGSERWALHRQALALGGQAQTLLVLTPLEHQLESESLQAWQQLVQVLTHEIMNSLTPIRSLSETAQELLNEPDAKADLQQALHAIAHRAESLAGFVGTYRRVSQWPAPQMAPLALNELFARMQQAVAPAWLARGGEARFEAPPGLMLQADAGQLEQALLALLTNAEQATSQTPAPRLHVQARQGRGGRLLISVRDNGPGVPPGLERQIFLPFFSAREIGEAGQGIGLTVVRQLVHGMGGRVRHVRPLEGGAAFVLSF